MTPAERARMQDLGEEKGEQVQCRASRLSARARWAIRTAGITRTRPPMDPAAYHRALRAVQKEKQQAKEAQGQTTIDQAFKKTKK